MAQHVINFGEHFMQTWKKVMCFEIIEYSAL